MTTFKWLTALWLAVLLAGGASAAGAQDTTTPEPLPPVTETTAATLPAFPPPWVSPTPDETGAIIVIVQPGESLWVIAARAGLTLPELLALNNLTEADIINPGDALIIGYATPEPALSPEEGTPTATPPPPTLRPTETRAEAAICLTAYDDADRDGAQDSGETLRAGVAFTIYNTEAVVANYITDGISEPKCLRGLAPGQYRVTRSVAAGEVLTTGGDWALTLTAGSELRQAFGSIMGDGETTPAAAAALSTPAALSATATIPSAPPLPRSPASTSPWRYAGVMALFLGGLTLLGAVLILLRRQSRGGPARPTEPDAAEGERRFRNIDDLE